MARLRGVEDLSWKLIGKRQVKSVTARFVEILGNRRRYEILKFINVNIKGLHVAFLNALATFTGRRPEVA